MKTKLKVRRGALVSAAYLAVAVMSSSAAFAQVGTLRDGNLVAWGGNGFPGALNPPTTTFSQISAGDSFAVGLTPSGALIAWGQSSLGQLMVPAGTFSSVHAGGNAGLAITAGGTIATWGDPSNFTTLASSPAIPIVSASVSYYNALVLNRDGQLFLGGSTLPGHTLPPAGTYSAMASGDTSAAGIQVDGTLSVWGTELAGEVSGAPTTGFFTAVAANDRSYVAIRDDTTLVNWGNGISDPAPAGGGFVAVSHASTAPWGLALRSDGSLAAWGSNTYGQQNVPAGVFTAIAHNFTTGYALRGATSYAGDLRVFGSGVTANLNRSVTVAGNVSVESPLPTINRSTLTVGGDLTLRTGNDIYGDGAVSVAGDLRVTRFNPAFSGAGLFVPVTTAGRLTGDGDLFLGGPYRYQFGLTGTPAFAGNLDLSPGSTLAFTGTGIQTCSTFRNDNGGGQGGTIRIGPGQSLVTNAAWDSATNSGTILLNPSSSSTGTAELSTQGQLLNLPNGVISARNALLSASAGLVNDGGIAFTSGNSDVLGKVTNNATGTLTVTGGATVVFNDDVRQNGTMVIRKLGSITSTAIFLGAFSGSGGFTGGGTAFIEGDLAPGNSPAAVLYGGDVVLGPTSSTLIEIGGRVAGTTYDQLNVTGELVLGGTLDLRFINGFTRPGTPATYDIITAGTLTGMFDHVIFPDASIGWRLYRTPTTLSLGSFAVVPDPGALAGLCVTPATLLARRRRQL